VLEDFGMPMGPLALLDEVGFDIAAHAAASLFAAYGERATPSSALEPMIGEKRLGKKSGRGFYVHAPGAKRHSPGGKRHSSGEKRRLADDLARFVPAGAAKIPPLTDQEIVDRTILAMVAEAARALEDDVVAGPRELDLATVFGMGFPPFRGGLLRHADALGIPEVVARLVRIANAPDVAARPGGRARFEPARSLCEMAEAKAGFHARERLLQPA
jgi:3-hydroxyacyl-CoA dehydrogenase/enoyl-CoA hydratase/3-hydroxybutyryl-CoA epimerase